MDDAVPERMRTAATALLDVLDEPARAAAGHSFEDRRRRWLEYRPRPRPGVCLADLDRAGRKAAHRLLATALSPGAYAQAMAVVTLEEVLDRAEGWRRGRHSGDYWVAVYGDPGRDDRWAWRFEGHHLSVSMTVVDDEVSPAPVFLGANPAAVTHAGRPVLRPLGAEEDLARELLTAIGPAGRDAAIIADDAPADIISATRSSVDAPLLPLGVPRGRLGVAGRSMLDQLVALYLDRLPAELAAREADRLAVGDTHFAWAGSIRPGGRHYYRVQGDDLLIEYDNTADDGNHAHTVLRRPASDFGADILADHHTHPHP
ncbi:DUF3500 domain-containing protein [Micromonospora sp. KC721]|uniref:DUF3500 domain-containing protein n=1 Tax=Micromonospora sp. KC721 TaxID=2530380 RepID=UPI00104B2173|nr:DUF3500 domain-containing protein [Micromonospora sp. KC721]TDB79996.1 DUF3500 domain-containing protein [Micromonospora sp. KC721]